MAKLIMNKKKFYRSIRDRFIKTMETGALEMQEQLLKEYREYPHTTYRKEGRGVTGIVAGSPRDVVDTGELTDSFDILPTQIQYLTVKYQAEWSAPHAEYVYTGAGNQPPYPWIKLALRRIDLMEEFEKTK